MSATAVSYGTIEWLRTLAADGWRLTVAESRLPSNRIVLHTVEDDFEPLELAYPGRVSVGVLAVREPAGVFVPCPSETEARDLLEQVMEEEA